ncbi:hypothetical protein pb186bvf_020570 [Paramecium bursaria]
MNKQKKKQQNENLQKVPKKAFQQIIYKTLYYPKTQTNRKLFEIYDLDVMEEDMYLELNFDLSAWINLNMIIKLRQYEVKIQSDDKIQNRIIFFSRPLMREIIKYFLIQIKQENSLYLISLDYQEIWINYKIIEDQIEFKKIVILNEFSDDGMHFIEHKSKINEFIMEIAKQFKIDDYQFYYIQKSNYQLLQYIDNQLKDKQAEFNKMYQRPYNQTDLRKLMNFQQNNMKKQISLEDMIQDNFYFELYLFKNIGQSEQKDLVVNKINELKKSIQSYIQQYDVVLKEIVRSEQLKNQIQLQLLEGLKSQRYLNYLDNFINSHFNLEACIKKSWLETQFLQLIIEEEFLIKRYCLYKITVELFQVGTEKKFLALQNYVNQLREQIMRKIEDLVTQMPII